MADFLLELLSEEIPARMQDKACKDLQSLFEAELAKAGLAARAIETYATPRRLALIARGLPLATEATTEEIKGPRADAPAQALGGFLGKTGLTRDQLVERADAKGNIVLFALIERPGRATAQVLAEAVPAIVCAFPWPKSMRWGAASASSASLRWVRPLQGVVALLGDDVVPFEIDGVASGAATLGHRFRHPGPITIGNADDYAAKLRACHVIISAEERRAIIRDGAAKAAAAVGLSVVPDEGLVAENAGLTEWPVPLLGHFDPAFLDVPREVIQLTMRTNQKYFACVDGEGKLAPAFICTANVDAADGGASIVAGNAKVLAARLSDAKFFWEQDLKVPLERQAKKLDQIVFHEKLGTVADKVERVAKLARWLVEEGIVGAADDEDKAALADMVEQAARLAKADLVTGMVGEFPELQGVMGGYYARAEGLPDQVADAIRDHYGPIGSIHPKGAISISVALADKLDNLIEFFSIDERPTGSRDPFALRRSAIQSLFLIMNNKLRIDLARIASRDVRDFVIERWIAQNRAGGGRPDLIEAVTSGSSDSDLFRVGERMRALEAFIATDDGANLLVGYKRAANILRKEGWDKPVGPAEAGADVAHDQAIPLVGADMDSRLRGNDSKGEGGVPSNTLSYTPEKEEADLLAALDVAESAAARAVEAEDFEGAMVALAGLRAPIDAFFDKVTVNDADPGKREARLGMLARIRDAVHRVADFSRIEG